MSMFSSSSSPPLSPSSSLIKKKTNDTYVGLEDISDPILEQFLERLPISDYIRFAAVCLRWKSVQRNHRLRHSPSPPPMLPLPLLLPYQKYHSLILSSSWYSPFEHRFYRFNLSVAKKTHLWINPWMAPPPLSPDSSSFLIHVPFPSQSHHLYRNPTFSLSDSWSSGCNLLVFSSHRSSLHYSHRHQQLRSQYSLQSRPNALDGSHSSSYQPLHFHRLLPRKGFCRVCQPWDLIA